MFACLTLCHSRVIDAVLLCTEHWEDLVCQVEDDVALCDITALPVKFYIPFPKNGCVFFTSPLEVVEYSRDRMQKSKAAIKICPMSVIRHECFFL